MGRRFATIPALVLVWALMCIGLPIWLPLALVVGLTRRRSFVLTRLGLLVLFYCTMELLGLVALTGAFLVGRAGDTALHYRIQVWWAGSLFRAVVLLLGLDFRVEGSQHVSEGPFLLLMRHASLADTLIPAALVCAPHGIHLRYVLKKELLVDPALDIAGNRLPNVFVDRGGDTASELGPIRDLVTAMPESEGVLIYPEGTRYSEAKRIKFTQSVSQQGGTIGEIAAGYQRVLPPRTAGTLEILDARPLDVVVLHIFTNKIPQMRLTEDKHLIQTFMFYAPNKAFNKRIQIWRCNCRLYTLDTALP